jgi:tyrosinase
MATRRPNQRDLSSKQQKAFVAAVNSLHGTAVAAPAYRVFVQVHVEAMSMTGMSFQVHTMPGLAVLGRNFLSWHRRFLWQFEQRLQAIDPHVAVPYWDPTQLPVQPTWTSPRPGTPSAPSNASSNSAHTATCTWPSAAP